MVTPHPSIVSTKTVPAIFSTISHSFLDICCIEPALYDQLGVTDTASLSKFKNTKRTELGNGEAFIHGHRRWIVFVADYIADSFL